MIASLLTAVLALPPTSIRAWDNYASALQSKKGAYFAVKTKFALDSAKAQSGETYNFVQVTVDTPISDVDSLRLISEIRKQYRELVAQMPVVAEEYETTPEEEGSTVTQGAPDNLPPF